MGRFVMIRLGGWWVLALGVSAWTLSACSHLGSEVPVPDGGDAAVDVEVEEPPDPPGPSPWTRVTPVVSPPSRFSHALVYDPVRGKVILFGGYATRTLRDLWEWDGETRTWTDRTPTALPVAWPPPRLDHTMVWDPARGRVVLFGGDTARGIYLRDVWEWDGQAGTWTNRTPTTIPVGAWPQPRFGHGWAVDEARGKLVLFGGAYASTDTGGGTLFQDTWEWDGLQGTWVARTPTPVPPPSEWPSGRRGQVMVWDGKRQRVTMLMGFVTDAAGMTYDPAIWEWDGVMGLWHRASAAPPQLPWPRGRQDHDWVWDSVRDRFVLFGGWRPPPPGESTDPAIERDLWEFDPGAGIWTDRTLPAGSVAWPLGRAGHAIVFDAKRARVLLFGGSATAGRLRDTWEWDGTAP